MKYVASVLFSSSRDDDHEPLWEERFLLVEALGEEEAISKAEEIAMKDSHTIKTKTGASVIWRFDRVERACLVEGALDDGTELFSRFLRESEVKSMLRPFND